MKVSRFAVAAVLAAAMLLSSGCDSDRLAQFGNFAAAGTAYVASFHTLTKDAGSAFIAADSATFITARAQAVPTAASAPQTITMIASDDVVLKNYLGSLQALDAHADVLASIFTAIAALTNGKASAATVTSVNALIDSLNTLNPQIEKVNFGGKSVKDYAGTATSFVVTRFEVHSLNKLLEERAPVIDRALALQVAAVTALSDQLKTSLSASLESQEQTKVLTPYVSPGSLPASWAADREAYIRQNVVLSSASSAQAAIKTLRADFGTLVQDPKATIDWKTLLDLIGKMASYVAAAEATK
jgi:hypothetical protein